MAGRTRRGGQDGPREGRRGRRAPEPVTAAVASGTAELVPDPDRPRAWTLYLDGAPQSHVDLDDPARLDVEYLRRLGHAADLAAPPGRPVRAVHLGGGGLTLPRYVAATRPRSRQQVLEVDGPLVEFVREALPWPRTWQLKVRARDARAGLAATPDDWADLVVADVYADARIPRHLTTAEFVAEAARTLAPAGVYAANVVDGPGTAFLRSQVATVRAVLPEVCLAADPAVLRGRRRGNAVLLASAAPLPAAELTRLVAADPFPGRVVHGAELDRFAAGAPVLRDAGEAGPPSGEGG
ncbi:fused MFS/spermidine synthase [Streptomyces capparidis]